MAKASLRLAALHVLYVALLCSALAATSYKLELAYAFVALALSLFWLLALYSSSVLALLSEHMLLLFAFVLSLLLLPSIVLLPLGYLALELQAFALYAYICALRSSEFALEAALKYYVLGSSSSVLYVAALLLLSMALGSSGLLDMLLLSMLALMPSCSLIEALLAAFMALLCALLFKLSIGPFLGWLPEVLEASSVPIAVLISAISKLSLFAFIQLF